MDASYYTPDYTGDNPDYLVQDDIYYLFQNGQTIEFPNGPVYLNSITMTTTDGQGTSLTLGTDFAAGTIDYTAMSRAKNSNSNFSSVLVKSITILRTAAQLPVQVAMDYQQFYATTPDGAIASGEGTIEVTPSLVIDMLRRISGIEQTAAGVTNTAALSSGNPALLDYDINETLSANLISNEVHALNTAGGINVIFPVQGAFFKDSVVLSAGTYTLVEGTDYQILGCDRAKTAATTNTSGIYTLILVTYVYVGDINLTYHAVGGSVSTKDLTELYTVTKQIVTFLNESGFVTTDSLYDLPAIKSLTSQMQSLEDNMRSLLSGKPTYGDTTTGTTIVNQIRANDTSIHWWTIGSLYKVAGSTDIIQADRMSLHVQLVKAAYQADVDIAVDLTNTNYPVTIEARNVVIDPGFVLYGNVDALLPAPPQFRVIWNSTENSVSGALIQIGLSLPSLTETLGVEDRSGVESGWILNTTVGTTTSPSLPADTSITLPDGSSVWSSTASGSLSVVKTLGCESGYLVSASQVAFTSMDLVSTTQNAAFVSNMSSGFRVQDIKSIDAYVTDNSNNRYVFRIPMAVNGTVVHGSAVIPIGRTNNFGTFDLTINPSAANTIVGAIFGQATIADGMSVRYLVANV